MEPHGERQGPPVPNPGFALSPTSLEDLSDGIRATLGWMTAHVRGQPEASLTRFVELAAQLVPQADAATLVQSGDGRAPRAYTDTVALQADQYQCRIGEGPAVLAANRRAVILVHDLASDPRWPRYGRHVGALGLLSALCVPAGTGDDRDLVLTVFSRRRGAFGPRAVETAVLLAEVLAAGGALAATLLARARLEQAKGIVMAENRCSAEEALRDLRASAAGHDVRLDELAERVSSRDVQPWDESFPRRECRIPAAS